jgi:arsenate reductase
MGEKKKILFLCAGNSCRSQMAEAWTRHLRGNEFEAYSAGIEPRGVDPGVVQVMDEVGIDISFQKSKDIDSLGDLEFDYVITLCDNAYESCPYFPARTELIHRGFDDPPKLAQGAGSDGEALDHYRRVRDEIKEFIRGFPE